MEDVDVQVESLVKIVAWLSTATFKLEARRKVVAFSNKVGKHACHRTL